MPFGRAAAPAGCASRSCQRAVPISRTKLLTVFRRPDQRPRELLSVLGHEASERGARRFRRCLTSGLIFSPWVLLGTTLLIFWLLSRMTLLGWADLSYVLPVTSIGYVLSAILGKILLRRANFLAALAGNCVHRDRHQFGWAHDGQYDGERGRDQVAMKWLMVAIIVGSTALGRSSAEFRDEAARRARPRILRPGRWGSMLGGLARRGPLVLAVFFMAISFFAFMKLLSVADLSFAVPVTAASVVLETVLARLVLGRT